MTQIPLGLNNHFPLTPCCVQATPGAENDNLRFPDPKLTAAGASKSTGKLENLPVD
jgi:hypothetical protein